MGTIPTYLWYWKSSREWRGRRMFSGPFIKFLTSFERRLGFLAVDLEGRFRPRLDTSQGLGRASFINPHWDSLGWQNWVYLQGDIHKPWGWWPQSLGLLHFIRLWKSTDSGHYSQHVSDVTLIYCTYNYLFDSNIGRILMVLIWSQSNLIWSFWTSKIVCCCFSKWFAKKNNTDGRLMVVSHFRMPFLYSHHSPGHGQQLGATRGHSSTTLPWSSGALGGE